MENLIKNIARETPLQIANEVEYLDGQIVSRTLAQNEHHSMTLFSFDKGEEIGTHKSDGDAMIIVLDGKGKITIDGKDHIVCSGETIIMPANKPHAVMAEEKFKMLLIVIFPED